jgi:tetratricopeptide (TPR) repeat protein
MHFIFGLIILFINIKDSFYPSENRFLLSICSLNRKKRQDLHFEIPGIAETPSRKENMAIFIAKFIQCTKFTMGNFFKSLFSSSETNNSADIQSKNKQKDFDIFKYDGIRALRMGQVQYAIKCYKEALKIREDKEVMQFLATAYVTLHETDEALNVMNRLVELEPEDLNGRLVRAELFYQMEKEQEAIADCLHVTETNDSQPTAWFLMGKVKRKLKDLSGSIADLTKAIDLKEDFVAARLLRAEIFFEANQVDNALSDIEKLIDTESEEEAAYLLRGRIYEYLGDLAAAANDYNQVVELNPFNEDASLLKGYLLIKEKRLEEAISFFDELIELKPGFAQAYRGRGKAKSLNDNTEGASEDEMKAEKLDLQEEKEETQENKHPNFNDINKGVIF